MRYKEMKKISKFCFNSEVDVKTFYSKYDEYIEKENIIITKLNIGLGDKINNCLEKIVNILKNCTVNNLVITKPFYIEDRDSIISLFSNLSNKTLLILSCKNQLNFLVEYKVPILKHIESGGTFYVTTCFELYLFTQSVSLEEKLNSADIVETFDIRKLKIVKSIGEYDEGDKKLQNAFLRNKSIENLTLSKIYTGDKLGWFLDALENKENLHTIKFEYIYTSDISSLNDLHEKAPGIKRLEFYQLRAFDSCNYKLKKDCNYDRISYVLSQMKNLEYFKLSKGCLLAESKLFPYAVLTMPLKTLHIDQSYFPKNMIKKIATIISIHQSLERLILEQSIKSDYLDSFLDGIKNNKLKELSLSFYKNIKPIQNIINSIKYIIDNNKNLKILDLQNLLIPSSELNDLEQSIAKSCSLEKVTIKKLKIKNKVKKEPHKLSETAEVKDNKNNENYKDEINKDHNLHLDFLINVSDIRDDSYWNEWFPIPLQGEIIECHSLR